MPSTKESGYYDRLRERMAAILAEAARPAPLHPRGLAAEERNNPNQVGLRYDRDGHPIGLDWEEAERQHAVARGGSL